ncbi:MAG: hypothetical protein PHH90_09985 [Limnochordia bacterium]|nr:hypothetical protein [Limnochordia bacterium]
MQSQSKRLKLDIMIPIFTNTFTERFDRNQEHLVIEKLIEYRDWIDQAAGEKMCQEYHLVLVDSLLSRSDIQEYDKDLFWMSAKDTWRNLERANISPSQYDMVWSLWAWKNVVDAEQMYGGGALLGPDTTPYMSLSVSSFTKTSPGITMVFEHEAQHTYEMLFHNTDQIVDIAIPLQGFPHADYLDTFLGEMLRQEPGLFEPFMNDAQAMEHRRDGPLGWPGMTMQRTVNAWTHQQQPTERYLKVAERFGQLVPNREGILVEPLFSSIRIVTDKHDREVFLPVRVRNNGQHVENVQVIARTGENVVAFEEDAYYRDELIRMPKKERWSVGWDGNSYYGGWVCLNKWTKSIDLTVSGEGLNESFFIPVKFITVNTEKSVLNPTDYLHEDNGTVPTENIRVIDEGTYAVYRLPVSSYAEVSIELFGEGYVDVRLSTTGRYYITVWTGETKGESIKIDIPHEVVQHQDYVYLQLRVPANHRGQFRYKGLSIVGREYL